MSRRLVRVPSVGRPFLDLFSGARPGPSGSGGLSGAYVEQIRRTVRRMPEVMVKVTGGGKSIGAVAAHLSYISQKGDLELETDEGQRVPDEDQKPLLKTWHLELSAGQYRESGKGAEKFGAQHRYVMALHTHQQHPHVHLVVKAEREDGRGRLHIDKAMLREWRQDFARMMRDQGIAANATSRVVRGQGKKALRDAAYRAKGRPGASAIRERVEGIARELSRTGMIQDPAHAKLAEIRKQVVAGWMDLATALDKQGEILLAGDVRHFAMHLPPVLTDRERLAEQFIRYAKAQRSARMRGDDKVRDRTTERTR